MKKSLGTHPDPGGGNVDLLHELMQTLLMSLSSRKTLASFLILASCLSICAGLRWLPDAAATPGAIESPRDAADWLQQAERFFAENRIEEAVAACRTGLLHEPWHPGLCLRLTRLLLSQAEEAPLLAWMDELVLGDARLAEQTFQLPEFAAWLQQPAFSALFREATFQARD